METLAWMVILWVSEKYCTIPSSNWNLYGSPPVHS
jgi:hypothetical protein